MRTLLLLLAALLSTSPGGPGAPTPGASSPPPAAVRSEASVPTPGRWPVWRWPLLPRPEVLRRFEQPPSRWGAGHRGLDLAGGPGEAVLAVAAGRVTHAGTIAGRGTVSVTHASGLRSTYEPVAPVVSAGDVVRQGQVIGRLTAGGHCARGCLHLGARRGEDYLDPWPLLTGGRVILLPVG